MPPACSIQPQPPSSACHHAHARAGQSILVGGAAGGIGSALIRFAIEAGLRVIATARPADHDRCLAQSASAVFDYCDANLARRVLAVVPGGADIHWDTSGKTPLNAMASLTATCGTIIATAGSEPQPPGTSLLPIFTRDISVIGFVVSLATPAELAEAAIAINRQLASGGLSSNPVEVRRMEEAAEAHALVESRRAARVIIQVRDAGTEVSS